MDVTKKHIKMCEKAFDDLGFVGETFYCVYEDEVHRVLEEDLQIDPGTGVLFGTVTLNMFNEDVVYGKVKKIDFEDILPIYSQDQLQEMFDLSIPTLLTDFYQWAIGKPRLYFNSMEQLWLAFVMKEKFNKVWNGNDWEVQR